MTKKFYLTRTQTRAMAADHPIGDPTGGAAYGEKNDPVTAIIAIGSMGATYTAMMAGSIMAGVAFAGAALSLVGNITGNSTLSKIGMVAGVIGGAGMMGAFGEGAANATWGSAFGEEAAKSAVGTVNTVNTANQAPVIDGKQIAQPAVVDVNAVPNPDVTTRSLTAAPNVNTPGGDVNALTTAPAVNTPTALGPPMAPADYSLANAAKTTGGTGVKLSTAVTGPPPPGVIDSLKAGNYGQALSTAGTNTMDMLKTNPTGAYVAAQAIGAAADWLSGKTDAELDALKANTGYANAKALEVQAALDREKMRRANLNAGYTNVNAGFTVNPNAAVTQPYQQPPGLVASAMQPRQG